MKITTITIISLLLFSCSNQQNKENSINQNQTTKNDSLNKTTLVSEEKITEKLNLPITDRFLRLIEQIDSSGYIFDTTRYSSNCPKIMVKKYILFKPSLEQTEQYDYYLFFVKDSTLFDSAFNICRYKIEPFQKSKNIFYYYYIIREPIIEKNFYGKNEKWYTDGVIEEWKFTSEMEAKNALEQLKLGVPLIYFNTGAYLCTIDNYMYVFHASAARFMAQSRKFFIRFTQENKVKIK